MWILKKKYDYWWKKYGLEKTDRETETSLFDRNCATSLKPRRRSRPLRLVWCALGPKYWNPIKWFNPATFFACPKPGHDFQRHVWGVISLRLGFRRNFLSVRNLLSVLHPDRKFLRKPNFNEISVCVLRYWGNYRHCLNFFLIIELFFCISRCLVKYI